MSDVEYKLNKSLKIIKRLCYLAEKNRIGFCIFCENEICDQGCERRVGLKFVENCRKNKTIKGRCVGLDKGVLDESESRTFLKFIAKCNENGGK